MPKEKIPFQILIYMIKFSKNYRGGMLNPPLDMSDDHFRLKWSSEDIKNGCINREMVLATENPYEI
jgi:hypothetical protein